MKHINAVFVVGVFCLLNSFAIPGIVDFMPTESGEYVFYRDMGFPEETYIGFLLFDEVNLAVRYYSPTVDYGSKNIELLVSLNPNVDGVEIAGEKIITPVTPDDVEKLNYLHDLLYEFGNRRKSINGKNLSKTVRNAETFDQFGGKVTVLYEGYVPIFNIRRILDEKGTPIFEMVSMGNLTSNDDNTFSYFTGLPKFNVEPDTIFTLPAKTNFQIVQNDNMTVKIPDYWEQKTNSVWVLENNAVLILEKVSLDEKQLENKKYSAFDYFTRTFLMSSENVTVNVPQTRISKDKKSLRVENICLSPQDYVTTRDIKIILQVEKGMYALFVLTVGNPVYMANEAYFRAIEKSFKLKK